MPQKHWFKRWSSYSSKRLATTVGGPQGAAPSLSISPCQLPTATLWSECGRPSKQLYHSLLLAWTSLRLFKGMFLKCYRQQWSFHHQDKWQQEKMTTVEWHDPTFAHMRVLPLGFSWGGRFSVFLQGEGCFYLFSREAWMMRFSHLWSGSSCCLHTHFPHHWSSETSSIQMWLWHRRRTTVSPSLLSCSPLRAHVTWIEGHQVTRAP